MSLSESSCSYRAEYSAHVRAVPAGAVAGRP